MKWIKRKNTYTLDEVMKVVEEVATNHLHPEFGIEWQAPDGLIYLACKEAQRQHRLDWADWIEGHGMYVGTEKMTQEEIVDALRSGVVPFGTTHGD